jgi:hypothetical protein
MMYEVDATKRTVRINMMMNLYERYEIYEEIKIPQKLLTLRSTEIFGYRRAELSFNKSNCSRLVL